MASIGQAAGLGLGLVGGYFFGPVGFSAGMMIGSWIGSQFEETDNKIIDPGAQEMPRINQALRGVTMGVLFGTNRVSTNLVWQNNFQTIRHENQESAGGGGKGGGSGGGGKGPKGNTTVSYEYKWDLFYHFGMVSENFNLFGGWLYSERMNDDTLIAITQGGAFSGNAFFRSNVRRPQTAQLQFEEAFFHGGEATGDTGADNWDHFETVVGAAHRFPYTTYIGFKALNLGDSASVPQLSFEIGPGNAQINFDSAYIGKGENGGSSPQHFIGQHAMVGDDGNHYYLAGESGIAGDLVCLETGQKTDSVTAAEFNTMWHDYTGLDAGDALAFTNDPGGAVVGNYVLLWGWETGGGSTSYWAAVLCKVNSSGILYAVGDFAERSSTIQSLVNGGVLRVGILGNNETDKPICLMYINSVSASRDIQSVAIASIDQMIAGASDIVTAGSFDARVTDHTATLFDYMGIHQSYRQYNGFGWFAPYIDIAATQAAGGEIQYGTKYCFYIGKADIEQEIDNPGAGDSNALVAANTGTYPNGFIAEIDLGRDNVVPSDTGNLAYINASFANYKNDVAIVPFDDAGENRDGTVDDNDDYMPNPSFQKITSGEAEGAYLVMFTKAFTGSEDLSPTGTYNKARMFIYNPYSQEYDEYSTGEGSTFDMVDDAGYSSGDRYNYQIADQILLVDQGSKNVYELRTHSSGSTTVDEDLLVSQFGSYDLGGGEDVLPPFIIHSILTSPVFGIGVDPDNIDTDSYNLALSYCDAEDLRVSCMYLREEGALKHIELLLAVYGGYLTESGGKIKFGLQDLSNSIIRTVDNHHLVVESGETPVTVTRGARQESYNKVKVNYMDRNLEYRQNFVELNDEVDQDLNGIRAREFPPKFVMTEVVAQKIAARTLWSNLYAKDIYSFKLGPKDADLEPGDVITLIDSFHPDPELGSGVRCRISQWEETSPMVFTVQGVKEVEYINTSTSAINSASNQSYNQMFGPVNDVADFRMYELPKEFQGANPTLFVGYNQLSPVMGARLYLSADGTSFAKADEVTPYIISGIFADALPDRKSQYIEENVKVYLMPDTRSTDSSSFNGFNPNTPTWAQTHALDDVGGPSRALGGGTIIAGSEALAFEGLNLIGQNEYRVDKLYRGWGGTNIQAHNSGAYWHKHAGGVFTRPYNEDKIGTIIHYKVVPFNFSGVETEVASVDARTYQIQGAYFLPQVQPPIQTFIESGITLPASENLGILEVKHVHSSGTAVTFQWPDAARERGYGVAGYGTGEYGRFSTDTTSHNWRVQVYSSDLTTVVRCTTVDSGWFVYSADTNSTDFNGWAGDFMIRVTPFNEFGDAPRDQTKRLQLFEQV